MTTERYGLATQKAYSRSLRNTSPRGAHAAFRPSRGFTLLEVAMALVTIVALSAITVTAMTTANRNSVAAATREAVSTVLVRAAGEAITDGGVYRVNGVRRSAQGIQINAVTFAFDCSTPIQEGSPEGAFAPACPAISVGSSANAAANPGAKTPGQMVAHIGDDGNQLIIVTMAVNRQCVTGIGRGETIDSVRISDNDEGTCFIPTGTL